MVWSQDPSAEAHRSDISVDGRPKAFASRILSSKSTISGRASRHIDTGSTPGRAAAMIVQTRYA